MMRPRRDETAAAFPEESRSWGAPLDVDLGGAPVKVANSLGISEIDPAGHRCPRPFPHGGAWPPPAHDLPVALFPLSTVNDAADTCRRATRGRVAIDCSA